jgi:hypothetical protein
MTETLSPPEQTEDIAELTQDALNSVQRILDTYIVFPSDEARDAVVLWTAHAHVFFAFESTPRLSVSSREPGSGKSRVLEILEHLVPTPLFGINITPGVMWHAIEHTAPTMLFDEVDTIFGKNGSSGAHQILRGVINSGHRKGATVPRLIGKQSDVKQFKVFAPVAMAGIGNLPDTIRTRSVEIKMRKRKPGQEVASFRLRTAGDALRYAKMQLEEWSMDAAEQLTGATPDMPVSDREADVWEPLVSIGDLAGGEWAERARTACEELTHQDDDGERCPDAPLFSAIRDLFEDEQAVIFTADLISGLNSPGNAWTFTPRSLSNILRNYGIMPTTVRDGDTVQKGYKREDFQAIWDRYLPNPDA